MALDGQTAIQPRWACAKVAVSRTTMLSTLRVTDYRVIGKHLIWSAVGQCQTINESLERLSVAELGCCSDMIMGQMQRCKSAINEAIENQDSRKMLENRIKLEGLAAEFIATNHSIGEKLYLDK